MSRPSRGETICGSLEVRSVLESSHGCPGFGPALRVFDHETGGERLVTVVDRDLIGDEIGFSEFMVAAHPATQQRHAALIPCLTIDREQEFAAVIHAFPEATRPLASELGNHGGRPGEIFQLATSLAKALAELHAKAQVHGCLCPANVWRGGSSVRVAQYGIMAACGGEQGLERFAANAGRRMHLAPELMALRAVSYSSDVYAWGLTILQHLRGTEDSQACVSAGVNGLEHLVPEPMLGLLARAVAAKAGHRPQDGGVLVAEMAAMQVPGASGTARAAAPRPQPVASQSPQPVLSSTSGEGVVAAPVVASDLGAWSEGLMADSLMAPLMADEASLSTPLPEPLSGPAVDAPAAGEPEAQGGAMASLALDHDGGSGVARAQARQVGPSPVQSAVQQASTSPQTGGGTGSGGHVGSGGPRTFQTPSPIPELERTGALPPPPRGPHGPSARVMVAIPLSVSLLLLVVVVWQLQQSGHPVDSWWRAQSPAAPESVAQGSSSTRVGVQHAAQGAGQASAGSAAGDPPAAGSPTVEKPVKPAPGQPVPVVRDNAEDATPPAECPGASVAISERFCIDATEYPRKGAQPITDVTKNQAELLCTRRKGRLCSAAEWRQACRGRPRWSLPHAANRSASHACQLASAAGFSNPLVDAGSVKRCRSPKGVFDMVGNAGEWVAGGRVLGGDSSTPRSKGHCDAEAAVPDGYRDRLVGFRCCYDR